MSERMTDERLAEIDVVLRDYDFHGFYTELLQALKAERATIERVRGCPRFEINPPNEMRQWIHWYPAKDGEWIRASAVDEALGGKV